MVDLHLMMDCHESPKREVGLEDDLSLDKRGFEAHSNHELVRARLQEVGWLICHFPWRSRAEKAARAGE